ncbi:MAG: heavy metal transport/detoxification protein [Rhizobiales bacterium]|uniref:heavy-metal-associated domain-containing protein n=1 Tax=Pelagibacterium sp. TaxID=1967288 RepID=UPI000C8AA7B4|nr:heavy metal transport/detoxification protein [Hyphomicrobiales bacterium]
MTCGGCANSVTKAVNSVDPKAEVHADSTKRTVIVESSECREAFVVVLGEAGYPVS